MNQRIHNCNWGDGATMPEFLVCSMCGAPHPSIASSIASARQEIFNEMCRKVFSYAGQKAFQTGTQAEEVFQIVELMEEFETIAEKYDIDID